jgi:hypothetical protein
MRVLSLQRTTDLREFLNIGSASRRPHKRPVRRRVVDNPRRLRNNTQQITKPLLPMHHRNPRWRPLQPREIMKLRRRPHHRSAFGFTTSNTAQYTPVRTTAATGQACVDRPRTSSSRPISAVQTPPPAATPAAPPKPHRPTRAAAPTSAPPLWPTRSSPPRPHARHPAPRRYTRNMENRQQAL